MVENKFNHGWNISINVKFFDQVKKQKKLDQDEYNVIFFVFL